MLSVLESVAVQSRTIDGMSEIAEKGERMLFLDGGGMRGLLELEVLMEIERRTGCKIKELFDWLVGTSVGGVICLSIVYSKYNSHHLHACFHTVTIDLAENTLEETRQMLMRLRNVFSSGSMVIGAKRRTKNMNKLLQAWSSQIPES